MIEGFSGHPLDQLRGSIALPVSMNLFPQPAQQRLEFSRGKLLIEIAQVLPGLFKELGPVEIAQRIGREIPDQSRAPMDILQTSPTHRQEVSSQNSA